MSDIIQLLPDSVANQIAAGEVIQRPASVVKELVENAIDAGASHIIVNIKDAGRTLIQVSDNGCGMSVTDARMAFERHATSKIREANDLFSIRTMGFRGEALASIAAVADVELQTRLHEEEMGTFLHISGSRLIKQEPVHCQAGTNFMIKNLFFNIPARRKFLKGNSTELKHIIQEIQRVALANPDIGITLLHNQQSIYELVKNEPLRKRIGALLNKTTSQNLIPINTETTLVKLDGYIGQPKIAKKTFGEQFFFVNKRYMKHPFFHRAIMQAYDRILPPDSIPSYFINFDIDPQNIDINIHPTKTEIKFEDEAVIWQVLHAAVREALGKFNVVPSIDFDQSGSIEIPIHKKTDGFTPPVINYNTSYNPFATKSEPAKNWDKLYDFDKDFAVETDREDVKPEEESSNEEILPVTESLIGKTFIQFKNKYILAPVKSGLMVINQRRAHQRILFESFMDILDNHEVVTQQQLFPQTCEIQPAEAAMLRSVLKELKILGFDIREVSENHFSIHGIPANLEYSTPLDIIEGLLENLQSTGTDLKEKAKEKFAASMARASAIPYDYALKPEEINQLIDQLFACSEPNFTPTGKKVLTIIPVEQFDKMFL